MRMLVLIFVAAALSAADYVQISLKDGRQLTGYYDAMTGVLDLGAGKLTISRDDIRAIEPVQAPAAVTPVKDDSAKRAGSRADTLRQQLATIEKDLEAQRTLQKSLESDQRDAQKRMELARTDDQRTAIRKSNDDRAERLVRSQEIARSLSEKRSKVMAELAMVEREEATAQSAAVREQTVAKVLASHSGDIPASIAEIKQKLRKIQQEQQALAIESQTLQRTLYDIMVAAQFEALKTIDVSPLVWAEIPSESQQTRAERKRRIEALNSTLADLEAAKNGRRDALRGAPFSALRSPDTLGLIKQAKPALYAAVVALGDTGGGIAE